MERKVGSPVLREQLVGPTLSELSDIRSYVGFSFLPLNEPSFENTHLLMSVDIVLFQ